MRTGGWVVWPSYNMKLAFRLRTYDDAARCTHVRDPWLLSFHLWGRGSSQQTGFVFVVSYKILRMEDVKFVSR